MGVGGLVEFEPVYVQEFFRYLELKELLTYGLCGVGLHAKGRRAEDSMLIREAITKLEGFLSGPDEALLSMLVGLEGWSPNAREEMLDFLKRVLSALRDETQLSEGEYEEMLNRLMSLHDRLKSTYKDVEEKMLARYRSRVVL
jgi:hypothetical protein